MGGELVAQPVPGGAACIGHAFDKMCHGKSPRKTVSPKRADWRMRRGGESGVEQKQKSEGLEPATLGQADPLGAGHDEVIQYPYIDQGQSVLESGGDGAISLGGLTAPGGVVVGKDYGSGIAGQRLLYHYTGIHRRAINGAVEQGLETEHLVFVVEEDGREDLVFFLGQSHLQELGNIGGRSERISTGEFIQ